MTKYHKLGGLEQQKFILSQFWKPRSKISVRGAVLSVAVLEGESFLASSCFWGLQVPLGLWQHHSSLCLIFIWSSPFEILTLITPTMALLSNKSTFQIPEMRTSAYLLGRYRSATTMIFLLVNYVSIVFSLCHKR